MKNASLQSSFNIPGKSIITKVLGFSTKKKVLGFVVFNLKNLYWTNLDKN